MFLRNLVTVLKRSNNSVFSATQNCQQLRTLRTKTVSTVVALTTKNKKPAIQANSSPKEENDLVINWEAEIDDMVADETSKSILAPVENPSNIDVEPTILPTFNFAAYVSKSETLQQFVKLGVDLSRLEKRKGIAKYILNLDFERDMKGHLMFLTKDINISPDYLSWFLTKNPLIFKESIVDLQTRINYLESKRFSKDEIAAIVSRNPYWLMFSTLRMDRRLGFFQREFGLSGNQMRHLTNILPKLITDKLEPIREIKFAVLEEMGFDKDQTKELLLKTPQIWLLPRPILMERYDYITKVMHIDNEMLVRQPKILRTRLFKIKQRHGFLHSIGKAQYDPARDLYIAIDNLVVGTDEAFVENIAKVPYIEFDAYLRTL